MFDYVVPLLLLIGCALTMRKKENAYACMLTGAAEGLTMLRSILPSLIVLLCAVSMLRASDAMDLISNLLAPVFSLFGIPPDTALLVLIRPVSGSAALAVGTELITQYGPDSRIGRTVAVMLGSTETTFYTISVYFGAAGVQKTRYTVLASLLADATGFFVASWATRLFWT